MIIDYQYRIKNNCLLVKINMLIIRYSMLRAFPNKCVIAESPQYTSTE